MSPPVGMYFSLASKSAGGCCFKRIAARLAPVCDWIEPTVHVTPLAGELLPHVGLRGGEIVSHDGLRRTASGLSSAGFASSCRRLRSSCGDLRSHSFAAVSDSASFFLAASTAVRSIRDLLLGRLAMRRDHELTQSRMTSLRAATRPVRSQFQFVGGQERRGRPVPSCDSCPGLRSSPRTCR